MNKEALLQIILSDIGEIETMLKSFQGQQNIPSAFIDLTEKKITHLMEEFSLLKKLNSGADTKPETQAPIIKNPEQVEVDEVEKKESSAIVPGVPEDEINEPAPFHNTTTAIFEQEQVITPTTVHEETTIKTVDISFSEPIKAADPLPIKTECKNEDSIRTLGDSFGGEKKSVNDRMAHSPESGINKTLKGKPISDLTKGLGINDRFMFQRELFEGNTAVMNQTLQQLNQMPDFSSAWSFILSNFSWDQEQEVTKAFINYVERKF